MFANPASEREVGCMPKAEVSSHNLVIVRGLTVNYDQTPAEAIEGLPNNNFLIASQYPQELWNGGKSGIVEEVTIPIYFPRRCFSTDEGRQMQSEIGYGLPAELAALKGEDVRQQLRNEGIWWIVALCQSGLGLWRDPDGSLRPVSLSLRPDCRGFSLGYAGDVWFGCSALVGAPQVP